MVATRSGVAVLGGTFDPVHYGHLRSAVEVRQALQLELVRLIPSHTPPHRDVPSSMPAQRLDMLRLATRDAEGIEVDEREIHRSGTSYSIDTFRSIRDELGTEVPLVMIVGFDAFTLLETWREWRALTELVHIAVVERPGSDVTGEGFETGSLPPELASCFKERFVDRPLCLHSKPGGMMCCLRLTQLDISSTRIRRMFSDGESPEYLMPTEVIRYVREHGLYGAASN